MDETVYVVQDAKWLEVIIVYRSLDGAKNFCARRTGDMAMRWEEHNAHGLSWTAVDHEYCISQVVIKDF